MAFITVGVLLVNGTTADATDLNNNYLDITDGLSNTVKDISISALTTAGVVSFGSTLAVTGISTFNQDIKHVGITQFGGQRRHGWVSNVGLNLAAGTLKLVQADGSTDFGAAAPGFVGIHSATGGALDVLKITATDFLLVDDTGSSDIIGVNFGTDSTEAWDQEVPFFLYAVNGDGTDSGIEFAISRNPRAKHSPATAQIAFHGTVATSDNSTTFFFLTSTDVTATHNAKPCLLIGGIRATKSALDDWTIIALDESQAEGILDTPHQGETFAMAEAQNGANADSFLETAGTEPVWATPSSIIYEYSIDLNGWVDIVLNTVNAGNVTNGVGGQALTMVIPYPTDPTYYSGTVGPLAAIYVRETGGGDGIHWVRLNPSIALLPMTTQGGAGNLVNTDFGGGLDDIEIVLRYRAY